MSILHSQISIDGVCVSVCVSVYGTWFGVCVSVCGTIDIPIGSAYWNGMSILHSQISIDDLVLEVLFATFRWKETKEIEIGDWN